MAGPEIHVCLVSEQLLANIIPVLHRNPSAVHMVVSDPMVDKANVFERFINEQSLTCRRHDHAPDASLQEIISYASKVAADVRQRHPRVRIVLNATGGTKPMAMGFIVGFRDIADEVIYTDTAHGCLEYLERDRPGEALPNVLDIPTYLAAQGMRYLGAESDNERWREFADRRATLTRFLANNIVELDSFIGEMNGLVNGIPKRNGALSRNGRRLVNPDQKLNRLPKGLVSDVLASMSKTGLIEWSGSRDLRFRNVPSARYAGGFWLEEYAWLTARDAGFHDLRCGVRSEWNSGSSDNPVNEFDTLAIHANRMLVVECKTLRLGRDEVKDSDILYKMDSLADKVGGLFAKSLLLSAREVSNPVRERARGQKIDLIDGDRLKKFEGYLRAWMVGG